MIDDAVVVDRIVSSLFVTPCAKGGSVNAGRDPFGHVEILVGADTENDCGHAAPCSTRVAEVV